MKRQIRRNVFETNSSSMHSLVIKKKSEYFTEDEVRADLYVNKEGLIRNYKNDNYFGRSPFQVLATLGDKANYVLASMCNYKDDDIYTEVCNTIREFIPEFKGYDVDLCTDTRSKKYSTEEDIKKYYGEGNYVEKDDEWIVWGYDLGGVDEDILTDFLEKENITIAEFLKNKRYVVVVDGDEYCIYKDMKENGLINTDSIEREYPERKW